MPKTASKKTIEKKLDKAWSRAILSKGRCEVDGSTQSLNAHHIVGRRNLALRWDLRNGVCLSAGYHVFRTQSAHQDPIWFYNWLKENRREDLEYLESKQNSIVKWTVEDLLNKLSELEQCK